MSYKEDFKIRSCEVDANGSVTIHSILQFMREAACNQLLQLACGDKRHGLGVTDRMQAHNLIWVVTTLHVEMQQYLKWGEVVEVETWFQPGRRPFTARDWVLREAASGMEVGRASSLWLLMNRSTRSIAPMPTDVLQELRPIMAAPPREPVVRIPVVSAPEARMALDSVVMAAESRDMDLNGHVSNVAYVDWMMQALPLSVRKGSTLSAMTVNYLAECKAGDAVESVASVTGMKSEKVLFPADTLGKSFHHEVKLHHHGKIAATRVTRWDMV